MTNKTCADINAALALSKEWLVQDDGSWFHPPTSLLEEDPPDFCGDSKYTGELLEGLPGDARTEVGRGMGLPGDKAFRCSIVRGVTMLGTGYGDTRREAIARAAHAMLKEGK